MVKPQSHSKPQNQAGEDNRLYRGVRVRKWGKWVAEVRRLHSRERIWLGSFETAEEAARAYDAGALCTRGPNTDFNFPNDLPPLQPSGFMPTVRIQLEAAKHAGNIVNTQLRLGPPCMADNVDVAGVGVGDGGGGGDGDGDDGLRCPEKPFFKFI